MKTLFVAMAIVMSQTAFAAVDFYQCAALDNQDAGPENKIRIAINEARETSDSEGNRFQARPVYVAKGMTTVLFAHGSGTADSSTLDLTLTQDDIIVGNLRATALEGTYYMTGTLKAQGLFDDKALAISCIHHN